MTFLLKEINDNYAFRGYTPNNPLFLTSIQSFTGQIFEISLLIPVSKRHTGVGQRVD